MRRIFKSIIVIVLCIGILLMSSCFPEPEVERSPVDYTLEAPQDLFPSFSPDGEKVAYFHDAWDTPNAPGYPSGLYIVNKDGSDRRLVVLGSYINSPSWSPDGQWLVFSNSGRIQKCMTNGTELTTFTGLNNLELFFPFWSSDGQSILFDSPFHPNAGLYRMTANFQDAGRIFSEEVFGRDPALSPDGTHIAYFDWPNNTDPSEIYVRKLSDNSSTRLTQNTRIDESPAWSPDGSRIIWSSNRTLTIIDKNGANAWDIGYGNSPSWSMHNEIVLSFANSDFTREVLFVVNEDGENRKQITF